ncbi:MAG TPA: FAD-binding oxidoreductase [bacterium]|nr:FAD-binding oxidoreductase [bacterium]
MNARAARTELEQARIETIPGDVPAAFVYGADATFRSPESLFVVIPATEEELIAAVRILVTHRIPMTPRGSGTGTTGGALPEGSALIFTGRLTGCRIDAGDLIAEVEPGVLTGDLKREAEKQGLLYPPDPASHEYATIGGNIATNAGGPASLKYGTTRDHLRKVRLIDGTGTVRELGAAVHKFSTGYFLPGMVCGSEGTLGIVTRAWLKLAPYPRFSSFIEVVAPTYDDLAAIRALAPAAMEYLDVRAGELVTGSRQSYLLIRLEAFTEAELAEQERRFSGRLTADGRFFRIGRDKKEIWAVRELLSPLSYQLGERKTAQDIVLPFSRIPEFLQWADLLRKRLPAGMELFVFGHLGDGNLHVNLMCGDDLAVEAKLIQREIIVQTRQLGGIISGEHGIGRERREALGLFIDEPTRELMRGIKKLFDPYDLMNPGKVI